MTLQQRCVRALVVVRVLVRCAQIIPAGISALFEYDGTKAGGDNLRTPDQHRHYNESLEVSLLKCSNEPPK